jgi:hypothetical protein
LHEFDQTSTFEDVKITDDYKAKIKLWAANPPVMPDHRPKNGPKFKAQKFSSYDEFNAWKDALWKEWAQKIGANPEKNPQDIDFLLELKKLGRL